MDVVDEAGVDVVDGASVVVVVVDDEAGDAVVVD